MALLPSVVYTTRETSDKESVNYSKLCSITNDYYTVTVTMAQHRQILSREGFIQDILSDKNDGERQFVISGLTPEEYKQIHIEEESL